MLQNKFFRNPPGATPLVLGSWRADPAQTLIKIKTPFRHFFTISDYGGRMVHGSDANRVFPVRRR